MEEYTSPKEISYQIAFQIIAEAGDGKSKAQEAIRASNSYDFETAESLLKEANDCMKNAHRIQTELLQTEAGGSDYEMNIILVHSQDHLTMAMMTIENAQQIILMNRKIQKLEERG